MWFTIRILGNCLNEKFIADKIIIFRYFYYIDFTEEHAAIPFVPKIQRQHSSSLHNKEPFSKLDELHHCDKVIDFGSCVLF